ncbi:peptide-methionine (R)-S-oxide reductase MsrB [Nostoc sp. FACHB-152]|uniref:peptide-methionine (R)-S-oxide reductase MsrB n=1 Tax=unclassified Nostoc TaxID=2593658 RepID=UPI001686917D|nr:MULTISPECIES: peptide-methionine (R)-S-oxide reductase MsrB [unclassified Nostoc]MBD2446208.1 peptide-methionine (R)-S-oxide reductase MsrB [Nostoc sp. FACHB-152]MBD2469478.1 peptide-methionine (R)-S-oxide reductase MsrB [Nostoc sp. FACHB-145]
MNKRYFLEASAVLVGTALFSYLIDQRSRIVASSNTEFEITKSEEEWRKTLTPEQFHVLRKHGTERAFTSPLDKQYTQGTYVCAGCELPLFTSDTKFNSGTGWPSFFAPIEGAIATTTDRSFFMTRVEVHCSRCGGHLGHVFNDGPAPTGQRYCMNGVALKFNPA